MKLGDRTQEVWCGDIVRTMEYIADIGHGRMLFYDIDSKLFRLVYPEIHQEGNYILNGWTSARTIAELLNEL